jgi:hypothetical protein
MTEVRLRNRLKALSLRRANLLKEKSRLDGDIAHAVTASRDVLPLTEVAALLGVPRSTLYATYMGGNDARHQRAVPAKPRTRH